MKTANLASELSHFTGTEKYHHHGIPGCGSIQLTDGCAYLREKANCYWLFDILVSILGEIKDEEFWSIKLKKNKLGGADFTVDDGNGKILYKQRIEYTDFPLESVAMFGSDQRFCGGPVVIMLTSEY